MLCKVDNYKKLTFRMMIQLAAPHTWAASVLPVFVAFSCAMYFQGSVPTSILFSLLIISVLMQSSVNTFNDYFDYKTGSDTKDDNVEPSDAVLLYNNINPKSALAYAISLLVIALLFGIYVIYYAGFFPLILGIIGAAIVVLYSGGKTPISYLPIGEFVSGFVMGSLISLASYQALTLTISFWPLIWSIPLLLTIGLIMMTNNTSDIEKDILSGRKTMPVLLGREMSIKVYRILVVLSILSVVLIILAFFSSGWIILPFVVLLLIPVLLALSKNTLTPTMRIQSMSQIITFTVELGIGYCAAILFAAIL